MKDIEIICLNSQGLCYGVKRSIEIADSIINRKLTTPIYILGDLVHNDVVNKSLLKDNVKILCGKSRIDMLDLITIPNSIVITTAHGVSDEVINKINEKGFEHINATCPYVKKSFIKIIDKLNNGYAIFFIGKLGHPEAEAVMSFNQNDVYLINESTSIFPKVSKPLAVACQTTMTKSDVEEVITRIKEVYNNVELIETVCNETEKRQLELKNKLKEVDLASTLVIVVGDSKSHNSSKLVELANLSHVDNIFTLYKTKEIDDAINKHIYKKIIITSGTSTPIELVNDINIYIKTIINKKED